MPPSTEATAAMASAMERVARLELARLSAGLATLRNLSQLIPLTGCIGLCTRLAGAFRGCPCGDSEQQRAALYSAQFSYAFWIFAAGLALGLMSFFFTAFFEHWRFRIEQQLRLAIHALTARDAPSPTRRN